MKKKLIYLTHARIPSEKTPSPFILKTCEGFVREGYDVELWVANRHKVPAVDPFDFHGIKIRFPIRRIPCIDLIGFTGKFGFPLMVLSFNVSAWFRLFRVHDVMVYAHDTRDVMFPSLLNRSLFMEVHDFYDSSIGAINRIVVPRVRGWIVTNRIKLEKLKHTFFVPTDRLLFQPNAVDYNMFAIAVSREEARWQLELPADRRLVMYTGHLYAWKGVYTLATATKYLPNDVDVYMVGGTEVDRTALAAFIEKEKLPRIRLIAHQPHEKIPLYLKAADALVLPNTARENVSKYETSPVKLFEYLASGVPIAASDLPSIREIVSEKEVVFAVPDDATDLARAIMSGMNDVESAERHAAAAQELARHHSWESRARNISTFIAQCMS